MALFRQILCVPLLFVAPYIGPRVRELLKEEGISFLDLTGNTWISLDHPGVFIEAPGAQRDPNATKPRRGLRGAKVGAVVRVLSDAAPPYTGSQIARAAGVCTDDGVLIASLRVLDLCPADDRS